MNALAPVNEASARSIFELPGALQIRAEKRAMSYADGYYDSGQYYETFQDADDVLAMVDSRSGLYLGHCTKAYKIIDHLDIQEITTDAIMKVGFDLTDVDVKDHVIDQGRAWIRQVTFPNESFYVGGEKHCFQLNLRNSYNKSYAFSIFGLAGRMLCFNGMAIGKTAYRYAHKHTTSLELTTVARKFENALGHFRDAPEYFELLQKSRVNSLDWLEFLKTTIAKVEKPNHDVTYNKARVDQITQVTDNWPTGYLSSSMRLWDCVNGLTAWATHHEATRSNSAVAQQRRLEEVQTATSTDTFQKFVMA